MTNADPLPSTVLSRKAVVYVRQSTQTQVQVHRESQRRQYDLVEDARRRCFRGPCRRPFQCTAGPGAGAPFGATMSPPSRSST